LRSGSRFYGHLRRIDFAKRDRDGNQLVIGDSYRDADGDSNGDRDCDGNGD